jgi:hypothetical protein
MYLLVSRCFLFLLLVADWAGDPYCGRSPLSRPLASQDAFCHSVANRAMIGRAITQSQKDAPILQASIGTLVLDSPSMQQAGEGKHLVLPTMDLLYALMSLQC